MPDGSKRQAGAIADRSQSAKLSDVLDSRRKVCDDPAMKNLSVEIEVEAPIARVWQAISDSKEFGMWLGAVFEEPFVPGKRMKGKMSVPEMAEMDWDIEVEQMVKEELFAYTWPPYAGEPILELRQGPRIRVEIRLSPSETGTTVSLTETGFDKISEKFREKVFKNHEEGWSHELGNLVQHIRENP